MIIMNSPNHYLMAAEAGVQPLKYGGKELDRENGLDWYDSHARWYDPALGRTTTMDPMAEDYPDISPYAWCAGNPVRFVDPTGMYSIENIDDYTNYMLISFYPTNRDDALETDYQAAKQSGIPTITVDDYDDFWMSLKDLEDVFGVSAHIYSINSHGGEGYFRIGDTKIDRSTDLSELKQFLSGKEIFIGACNTGKGEIGRSFVEHFSSSTQSLTVAPMHRIFAGYRYDGGLGLEGPEYNSLFSLFGSTNGNSFMVSYSGQNTHEIYNLRIDRFLGMTWNDGTYLGITRPYSILSSILYPW